MSDEKKKERQVIRSRSPHHRVVYANQTAVTNTGIDLRLRFGCVEKATPEELVVEDQVDVCLGPMEAMGLYKLLERQIKRLNVEIEQTPEAESDDRGKAEER